MGDSLDGLAWLEGAWMEARRSHDDLLAGGGAPRLPVGEVEEEVVDGFDGTGGRTSGVGARGGGVGADGGLGRADPAPGL